MLTVRRPLLPVLPPPIRVDSRRPLKSLLVVPAYGRHYSTDEKALADYETGKDFKIIFFGYHF